jgi:hypothetical protein
MAIATIKVDERVAAALRAQAEARQLPLTAFLQRIAEESFPEDAALPSSEDEWNHMFDEVSSDGPAQQSSFSRADIYSDHD